MSSRWSRREFLAALGSAAAGAALPLAPAGAAASGGAHFTWAQLRYPGSWDPSPRAADRFLEALRRRTSVETGPRRRLVDVGSPDLFSLPFLYVAGRGGFPSLGGHGEAWLRRYLEHGGFVLFDDATGVADSGFARGAAETLGRVFPGRGLAPLPGDHTVFQSFYLLRDVPGRKLVRPFLYGMDLEDLSPAILCPNDLGGAFDGDPLGGYTHPCTPGGERQREMTFRLGVNLVLYALTGNYKKDQVHIPFILKRRQR
ncbi:MAG: DUF4159 domain-containing protein [Deferrisomatales bacterium]|nr:DUF4159 domain-containing protein [Deferrisomatales bacterium]